MNKLNLRIISKIGLLLVIIGFFMPISCNLNGFQIASSESTFYGPNFISICLYSVFIFSCVGFLSLFILLYKKSYSIVYDWIDLIIVIMSFSIFIGVQTRNTDDLSTWIAMQMQYGAYIIFLGLLVSFVSLVFASWSKTEKIDASLNIMGNAIPPQNKDNSDVNNGNEDEFSLEYPDSFYNDKYEKFHIITGIHIKNAISAKKILDLGNKASSLTLKEIIKNTDITLEEAEFVLSELVSVGFAKIESDANGNSAYLFEIKSAEKQIIDLAEKQFPITLEDIIKETDLEIEEIKSSLEKLIKIGFFIKCGLKVNTEQNIETVFYYVFSEQKIIEEHLQYLLLNEDSYYHIRYLIEYYLPLSIDFESYLISLLIDNKATLAKKLISILKHSDYKSWDDLYIRKLGYLSIKHGTEEDWKKKIAKHNIKYIIELLIAFLFPALLMGLLSIPIIFLTSHHHNSINIIIAIVLFVILLFLLNKTFNNVEKRRKKYLNSLFEIPE